MVQIAGQKTNKIKQLVSVDEDGNIIISPNTKINVDTIDVITTVDEVSLITSVTTVDEVSKAVLYGTDEDGNELPVL